MRLSDILSNGGDGNIRNQWESATTAGEFGPLPRGEYVARIIAGELKQSRSNSTPGYSLTFEVLTPDEFKGRKFWHDCWLTPAAMPQSKRDLGKLGVTSLEQLENPLPRFIRCKCKLALRQEDNGSESNRLRSFEVIGIDKPDDDPFAPVTANLPPPTDDLVDGAALPTPTTPN